MVRVMALWDNDNPDEIYSYVASGHVDKEEFLSDLRETFGLEAGSDHLVYTYHKIVDGCFQEEDQGNPVTELEDHWCHPVDDSGCGHTHGAIKRFLAL
jgi:hypothetical protein